ncbi:MAG: hypothetical protein A2905_05160 [Candidatus Levybacteria bacterium RIFCSPLOWO2_01_FULL_36_10]|nr:MAG: hypothetical protein A2905_05160 [Candidatus Levybacteria bacterium RIFCSPLOWO2_01_FULL_36_10]
MDPKKLSPDLKQMYEKVMSTPVKPVAPPKQPLPQNPTNTAVPQPPANTPPAPVTDNSKPFVFSEKNIEEKKETPLTPPEQNMILNMSQPQKKSNGILEVSLGIIFFTAYTFFWLIFFGIIKKSSLGL